MDTILETQHSTTTASPNFDTDTPPSKLQHRESFNLGFTSSQSTTHTEIEDNESDIAPPKRTIFKIIRDVPPTKSSNIPLSKDFGSYNRKEKSLGELSKRLLIMFGRVEQCTISLDTVTQYLGVERRRIYDIINILESLGVVYRKGKNSYQWKGLKSIFETIEKLQGKNFSKLDEQMLQDCLDDDEEEPSDKSKVASIKREKSLGLLSTGFIKLFLSWKGTISLEQAGRKLSSDKIEENKIKTKIRRLYDIANVFSSLGLIKKTCLDTKKPAYEWIGLPGLSAFITRLNSSSDEVEIFQEASLKHKEKVAAVSEVSPIIKKEECGESASPVTQSIKGNLFQPQGDLGNLLGMLMSLYTAVTPRPRQEESLPLFFRSATTPLEAAKLLRQTSNPESLNTGLITPCIRKSVSIIQRADSACDFSTEKKQEAPKNKGFCLYDKGGVVTNGKRKPQQSICEFEKTVKKLHTFDNCATEMPVSKLMNFSNRENLVANMK